MLYLNAACYYIWGGEARKGVREEKGNVYYLLSFNFRLTASQKYGDIILRPAKDVG
jgi:hypothetical protein